MLLTLMDNGTMYNGTIQLRKIKNFTMVGARSDDTSTDCGCAPQDPDKCMTCSHAQGRKLSSGRGGQVYLPIARLYAQQ